MEAYDLRAGRTIRLNLPELEVSGVATITALSSCPPIATGEGSVITARFMTRQVDEVTSVEILGADGATETITGTSIHPVWSVDRQVWVPLAELEEGETLQGIDGPAIVLSVSLSRVSQPVYNIEVHGEHVYQVGELGVLVHNSCFDDAPVSAAALPWARAGAARAAKAIEAGQASFKVASRDDAAELIWRMFRSKGYTDTTMFKSGSVVKQYLGTKAGTYHWDDVLDAAGNVAGHGAGNAHGAMRHVQIHLQETGKIIRIFFP